MYVFIFAEFKTFVEGQQSCLRQWADAEGKMKTLQSNILALDSDNKSLDVKLKHAR